ncbi:MAG: guanylate kinase [Elusimicrobia bacterium]|nr:guanylate kinase [Elusimicrobiota bacterium]
MARAPAPQAQGRLVVISAPSGTGKSTLCRELLKRIPNLIYCVSCTTRPPRPAEQNGRDYFFLTESEFRKRAKEEYFLEWAEVHGHLYGVPKDFIREKVREGRDVLLPIDVQGGASVRRAFRNSVLIFLAPPSWESLESRLRGRGMEEGALQRRLQTARGELARVPEYDYLVVNDDLDRASQDVEAILRTESLRVRKDKKIPIGA